MLPVGGCPWPSAQACLSLPPCQGSTLHLPIGYRIFPPPGCICLPFTKQSTHIFCFLYVSEQSPSHRAQPSLTFPPLEWISTCLTTWGPIAKKDHTLCHHETKPVCRPQQAGPLPQHVPWASQPDPGTCGQLPILCCQVTASPEGVWAWRIMGLGYQAHQKEEYVVYKLPWVIPQFVSLILLAFHSST